MEIKYRLLDHPFYQSWEMGQITKQQLADYGLSYKELITEVPTLWTSILSSFKINDAESNAIIEDEKSHINLWDMWIEKNEKVKSVSGLSDLIEELKKMNPSELLGAIHSFEVQQPEVAITKKKGLINHYGFNQDDLIYFDEHQDEQKHIDFGLEISSKYADKDSFLNGFNKGSELFYNALNRFVN